MSFAWERASSPRRGVPINRLPRTSGSGLSPALMGFGLGLAAAAAFEDGDELAKLDVEGLALPDLPLVEAFTAKRLRLGALARFARAASRTRQTAGKDLTAEAFTLLDGVLDAPGRLVTAPAQFDDAVIRAAQHQRHEEHRDSPDDD